METQELVDDLRRRGVETTRVELKAAAGGLPKSTVETLSAFANARGGTLLLDIDNDLRPVDADVEALRDALSRMASTDLVPPLRGEIDIEVIDGKHRIVRFDVPEVPLEDKPCYVSTRGRYHGSFIRSGEGDHRLTRR
ncbi:helix-turn-helix domain-containing protein [Brachybacterium sp. UMB0905]|uniref:AlbA family DNA-binding domain-containing protein n=1 Tax=Brachybacterium sp. UMB0905 TaxID=2069310 RepID=UPI000C80D473|nr:ATP-binding protein [Brachybacterium sp. UMB0905]PMC76882.1 hypothetical protein CJ197_00775 [Brachybacterium sp. UMB0905]